MGVHPRFYFICKKNECKKCPKKPVRPGLGYARAKTEAKIFESIPQGC